MIYFRIIALFLSVLFVLPVFGQQSDSVLIKDEAVEKEVRVVKQKNPKRASWLSAALPGAGQVYNGKYWKVPVVYGAVGSSIYMVNYNNAQYQRFLNAYILENDDDTLTVSEFSGIRTTDNIEYYKDQFRRSRDLWAIGVLASYLLNIIDASVDAHLSNYDISDDLSLYYRPQLFAYNRRTYFGVTAGIYIR